MTKPTKITIAVLCGIISIIGWFGIRVQIGVTVEDHTTSKLSFEIYPLSRHFTESQQD